MKLKDAFKTATSGIRHARMRSFLTMLGIVIGVASVILLMSIGASAQRLILDQVQGIGSNLVFVIPGATKGQFAAPSAAQGIVIKTLVKEDLDALRRDSAINSVTAEVRGIARIIYENIDTNITYQGVTEEFFEIRNFGIEKGYAFTNSDSDSFNHVAVIGSEIGRTLFGNVDPVGKSVRIKDISFRVVGVLESKGLGPFGVDQDNVVLLPLSVAQKQLLGINHYNSITIEANSTYDIEFTKSRITSILRQTHRITDPDKDDFTIRTQEDALSLLGSITSILTVFLTSIAFISLIVGGIGIMNIMLVSVIERTKEIGLRKAVGATYKDILQQFLLEAILLTSIGGIAGILLGTLLTTGIYFILVQVLAGGWVFALPTSAILLGVGVSVFTGIIFGIYPASQAAKKSPIEALRYE